MQTADQEDRAATMPPTRPVRALLALAALGWESLAVLSAEEVAASTISILMAIACGAPAAVPYRTRLQPALALVLLLLSSVVATFVLSWTLAGL